MKAQIVDADRPSRSTPPSDRRIEAWRIGEFEIVAGTDRGLVRSDNQDAYAVAIGPPLRVAVFDGVGGIPNGGEAARAAAARLSLGGSDVFRDMDAAVRRTKGATTAAVAEISGGSAAIRWIGDSCAYRLTDDVELLGKPHRSPDGRLTQALGFRGSGQTVTTTLGTPLLLCTDGIPRRAIAPVDGDLVRWANRLIGSTYQLGAPDNLTFVVIRRSQAP